MTRLKKILAPTDFSRNSRVGLSFALSLAAENSAELVVLHVESEFKAWQIPDEAGFFSDRVYRWEVDRIVREATLDLNNFLEKYREELRRVPQARRRVVLGDVVEKIVDVARDEEADLVVMSPRAHGSLRRFFLGSVTDKVTRRAPCPVLSICSTQVARQPSGRRMPTMRGILQGSEA
jgi:nucleotide-binding universal stress UspA family protein